MALSQPKVYFKIPPQRIERMYEQYPQQKPFIEKALKKLWTSFRPFMKTQTMASAGVNRLVREDTNEGGDSEETQTGAVEAMKDQTIIFENHKDIDFLYLLASFRSGALQFSTLRFREGELSPALFEMCLLKEL